MQSNIFQDIIYGLRINKIALDQLKNGTNIENQNIKNIKTESLKEEEIEVLSQKISNLEMEKDYKEKLQKILKSYKVLNKKNNLTIKKVGSFFLNKGLFSLSLTPKYFFIDKKLENIMKISNNFFEYIVKYLDQVFFDINENLNDKNNDIKKIFKDLESFLNIPFVSLPGSKEIKIESFLESLAPNENQVNLKTDEKKEENIELGIQQINNAFDLTSMSSFKKISNELKNNIDNIQNIDFIDLFLENIFDLSIESSLVLESREKIENIFKYFGIKLEDSQSKIFSDFFATFSFEKNELIINYDKFEDFFKNILKFSSNHEINSLLLNSNEIFKQIFNFKENNVKKEVRINIDEDIKLKLKNIIKIPFIKEILNNQIDQNELIRVNLLKNKEYIKILLNLLDHINDDKVSEKNKKILINLIEDSGFSNLVTLKNVLNENKELQNDFIDLISLFHEKIIDGMSKKLEQPTNNIQLAHLKRQDSISSQSSGYGSGDEPGFESGEEDANNLDKSLKKNNDPDPDTKDNNKFIFKSSEIMKPIIEAILDKKESQKYIKDYLERLFANDPQFKGALIELIESFETQKQRSEKEKIFIKPQKLLSSIKNLIDIIEQRELENINISKEVKDKNKKQYNLIKESIELFMTLLELNNIETERQIEIRNIDYFIQHIEKILSNDIICDVVVQSLFNENQPDLNQANEKIKELFNEINFLKENRSKAEKKIVNLEKKINDLHDEKNKLKSDHKVEISLMTKELLNQTKLSNTKEKGIYSAGLTLIGSGILANSIFLIKKEIISKKIFALMIGVSALCFMMSTSFLIKSFNKVEGHKSNSPGSNLNDFSHVIVGSNEKKSNITYETDSPGSNLNDSSHVIVDNNEKKSKGN